MNICSVCKKETERSGFDHNKPIYCDNCDPKWKCVVCGEQRMKPIGHTDMCEKHYLEKQRENRTARHGGLLIIDKTNNEYGVSNSHFKDMNTRVYDDDGEYLSGEKGLKYMKSKGDKYAGQLKEYYNR